MNRQERIDLVVRIASQHGLDPVEFLGGGFAESGINLDRWERWGIWPDVSFGMYHQTVAFADEGNQTNTPENIEFIKDLYFNPEHAATVAAKKFKHYRSREATALDAWCRYNWPARDPNLNPNRGNYAWGLQKAAEELGAAPTTSNITWGPDVPASIILQQNDWTCAPRSTYAALWAMAEQGLIPPVTYGDGGPRDVYDLLVPTYVNGAVGLKDASGAGLVQALKTWGIKAQNFNPVTLSDVQAVAGKQPVLIGGRTWYHWVYVRGKESDGTLMLENPSPGLMGIHWQLRDSFTRLGPFSMVVIEVPKAPDVEQSPYSFVFGFKTLAEEMGAAAGKPLENEYALNERFNVQLTTTGLMVYSKAENSVRFIRG